jgi:hypothetical protein
MPGAARAHPRTPSRERLVHLHRRHGRERGDLPAALARIELRSAADVEGDRQLRLLRGGPQPIPDRIAHVGLERRQDRAAMAELRAARELDHGIFGRSRRQERQRRQAIGRIAVEFLGGPVVPRAQHREHVLALIDRNRNSAAGPYTIDDQMPSRSMSSSRCAGLLGRKPAFSRPGTRSSAVGTPSMLPLCPNTWSPTVHSDMPLRSTTRGPTSRYFAGSRADQRSGDTLKMSR